MWQRIKLGFRNFMLGRHGMDLLNMDLLKYAIGLYLLSLILGLFQNGVTALISSVFSFIGLACWVYAIFRMFSRNNVKRDAENRRYQAKREEVLTKARQAKVRFQKRKEFKYFRCPDCKSWIRLPRGCGVVTVTCRKCRNSFTQKG